MLTEIGSVDNVEAFVDRREGGQGPAPGLRPPRLQELRPAGEDHQEDRRRGLRGHRARTRCSTSPSSSKRSRSPTTTSSAASSTRTSTSTRASSTRRWASPSTCSRCCSPSPGPPGWLAHWKELLEQDQKIARPAPALHRRGRPRLRGDRGPLTDPFGRPPVSTHPGWPPPQPTPGWGPPPQPWGPHPPASAARRAVVARRAARAGRPHRIGRPPHRGSGDRHRRLPHPLHRPGARGVGRPGARPADRRLRGHRRLRDRVRDHDGRHPGQADHRDPRRPARPRDGRPRAALRRAMLSGFITFALAWPPLVIAGNTGDDDSSRLGHRHHLLARHRLRRVLCRRVRARLAAPAGLRRPHRRHRRPRPPRSCRLRGPRARGTGRGATARADEPGRSSGTLRPAPAGPGLTRSTTRRSSCC